MAKKQKDELTTVEAARILGVDERTPRRWAKEILSGRAIQPRGAEGRLSRARRDVAGFYYLSAAEVRSLGVID